MMAGQKPILLWAYRLWAEMVLTKECGCAILAKSNQPMGGRVFLW